MTDYEGRYMFVNKRFEEWVCVGRNDIVGKTVNDLYPEERATEIIAFDQRAIKARKVLSDEIVDTYPDGKTRTVIRTRFPVITSQGEMIGLGNINQDITERKKAENELAEAHELITSSIDYASRIQRSALPPDDLMSEALGEHFVIWQPRDVVGGDIYWVRRVEGGHIVAVADCTGHGVPGAFLTMIATGALRQAIIEHPDGDPAAIIGRMNTFIKNSLRQDTAEGPSDDGLELGICRIDEGRERLTFAGARFSLWTLDGQGSEEVKGDKSGIGYHHVPSDRAFTNHDVPLSPDSTYYLFSDGLVDQVGGDKRRAFGKKRIIALLDAHKDRPIAERGAAVMREFEAYQGAEIRRDDVTMLGFVPVV